MIDLFEIAWAAGFFDGEGATTLYAKSRRSMDTVRQPVMTISQVNNDTLERFQRAVLGIGKIYGPYQHKNGRPQFVWRSYRWIDSQAVLALLWRFLGTHKQEQAARAFAVHRASIGVYLTCRNGLHPKAGPGKCIECKRISMAKWQIANAERLRKWRRNYCSQNRDKIRAWQRQHRAKNREIQHGC